MQEVVIYFPCFVHDAVIRRPWQSELQHSDSLNTSFYQSLRRRSNCWGQPRVRPRSAGSTFHTAMGGQQGRTELSLVGGKAARINVSRCYLSTGNFAELNIFSEEWQPAAAELASAESSCSSFCKSAVWHCLSNS